MTTSTPRDPDCWCHTNDVGPVKKKCCKFPFIYTGRTHHTCVEVEGGDSWCATSLDQDMEYVHGLWGYCSQECFFDTPTPRSNSTATTISSFSVEDVTETSVTVSSTSFIVSSSSSTADISTLPSTQPSSTTTHSPTIKTSAVSTSETSISSTQSTPQSTSPTTSYSTATIAWNKPSDYFLQLLIHLNMNILL